MMKSVKPGIGGSRARLAMGEFDVMSSDKGGTLSVSVAWDDDAPVASGAWSFMLDVNPGKELSVGDFFSDIFGVLKKADKPEPKDPNIRSPVERGL